MQVFSKDWFKEVATKPEHVGKTYSDPKLAGLSIYVANDHTITYQFRATIRGKRLSRKLDKFYHPTDYTAQDARDDAARLKLQWIDSGGAPKKNALLFGGLLDYYKGKRLGGDPLAQGKKKGMPKDWEKQTTRFHEMVKPLLARDAQSVTREEILDCKLKYLLTMPSNRGKDIAKGDAIDDRSLGPMTRCISQAFEYCADEDLITHKIARAITSDTYGGRTRFLLPGEIQRMGPVMDALPDDGGLFLRFQRATGARVSSSLAMRFDELDDVRDIPLPTGGTTRVVIWSTIVKGGKPGLLQLVGEAVRIIEHFRAQREEEFNALCKEHPNRKHKKRETVFPDKVVAMWTNSASDTQRAMEVAAGGLSPFHRHDGGRRTLATYFRYVDARQGHVSMALTHTTTSKTNAKQEPEAAAVTARYTINDSLGDSVADNNYVDTFDDDSSVEVVLAHLRVQELFRQMEQGELSPTLKRIQTTLAMGPKARAMMKDHDVSKELIGIVEAKTKSK